MPKGYTPDFQPTMSTARNQVAPTDTDGGMIMGTKGLLIKDLLSNLDVDGDGDIDDEDKMVAEELREMDANGDGYISLKELVGVGQSQLAEESAKRRLRLLITFAILLGLAAVGAMLLVALAAAEEAKETKASTSGHFLTPSGKLVKFATAKKTYPAAEFLSLPVLDKRNADEILAVQRDGTRTYYSCTGFDVKSSGGDIVLYTAGVETFQITSSTGKSSVKKCATCKALPLDSLTITVDANIVNA